MRNLHELLEEYGVPFWTHGEHRNVRERWTGADCPFCSPDTQKALLGFGPSGKWCSCWNCGSLKLLSVLKELTGLSAKHLLGLPFLAAEHPEGVERSLIRRGHLILPQGLGPLKKAHKDFLRSRQIPPEAEKLWSLQGIGQEAKLAWRIFFPLHLHGRIVSWTTRTVGNGRPKYLSAPAAHEAFDGRGILFGNALARNSVVVVEGPLDAMALGPGAVATCGVGYTEGQLEKIGKFPRRTICFDAEPAAQERAYRLCRDLAVLGFSGRTTNVILQTGKDPSRASLAERAQVRRAFLED
jgi:hypothetical protein